MGITYEEVIEATDEGDPIMITVKRAVRECEDHGADYNEYVRDRHLTWTGYNTDEKRVDAGDLLAWLGY